MNENPLKSIIKNFDAIIFDLDGTLLDSMWMWHQIDIEYLARFGLEIPEGLQQSIEGMSFSETAVYFKERFQIPDSLDVIKENWNQMARDKYQYEVLPKPYVMDFLKLCKENNLKLGIATSNSRELVEISAKKNGYYDYFSCIMTACEVCKGKPAPDIYLKVAETLQVLPEKCLVFEDIIPGIMAGQAAGMKVCAVEDAYSLSVKEEKKNLADFYIESYRELL